jgi:enoyl-CoA hydratase
MRHAPVAPIVAKGMRDGPISWELAGNVALLTIASPPCNALDELVATELAASLAQIESSCANVIVVRSGIAGYFAVGADVDRVAAIDSDEFIALLRAVREGLEGLASSALTSIAAVEGDALGGGLELALACTLRVAGRSALLGLPDVTLGLLPGGGGTQRLPRLIGRANALDLLVTGRSVDGQEARDLRLVDRVVDDGAAEDEALALALRLAGLPPRVLAGITRCVDVAQSLPFVDGMLVEADETVQLFEHAKVASGAAQRGQSPQGQASTTPWSDAGFAREQDDARNVTE